MHVLQTPAAVQPVRVKVAVGGGPVTMYENVLAATSSVGLVRPVSAALFPITITTRNVSM